MKFANIRQIRKSIVKTQSSNEDEISSMTLGSGFKGITDIETGPNGNLYVLTYCRADAGLGTRYRVTDNTETDVS